MLVSRARACALLTAALCFAIATPAHACRMLVPRPADLAEIKRVVLASIESSARLERRGWNTWRITARGSRNLDGSPNSRRYEFTVTLGSNGCDNILPPRGERWALYLGDSPNGGVLQAFPLDYVRDDDPRLAALD